MEKNWLIRTHSNQILGPVSKDKIIELFNKSALSELDEVCSGNGYWFFVREKDLVQKYIFGNATQTFNPVTETVDVLTAGEKDRQASHLEIDDVTNVVKLDSKQMASLEKKATNAPAPKPMSKEIEATLYPKDEDLAFPDLTLGSSDSLKKK